MTGGSYGVRNKNKQKRRKLRFCDIPFLTHSSVASCIGLVILLGGCAMTLVGYYAEHFATSTTENQNGTVTTTVDTTALSTYRLLPYIGSVIMGVGSFIIIIACVVVCEAWDRVKRIMPDEEENGNKKRPKDAFYDSIINNIKKDQQPEKDEVAAASNKKESEKDGGWMNRFQSWKEQSKSRNSLHSTATGSSISRAIRHIPMELFSLTPMRRKSVAEILHDTDYQPYNKTVLPDASDAGRQKSLSTTCLRQLSGTEKQGVRKTQSLSTNSSPKAQKRQFGNTLTPNLEPLNHQEVIDTDLKPSSEKHEKSSDKKDLMPVKKEETKTNLIVVREHSAKYGMSNPSFEDNAIDLPPLKPKGSSPIFSGAVHLPPVQKRNSGIKVIVHEAATNNGAEIPATQDSQIEVKDKQENYKQTTEVVPILQKENSDVQDVSETDSFKLEEDILENFDATEVDVSKTSKTNE